MRKVLKSVGISAAAGVLLLGVTATTATAAPVQQSQAQSQSSARAVGTYVGTYDYPTCLYWRNYFQSIGYGAYCVIHGSYGDLYVVA